MGSQFTSLPLGHRIIEDGQEELTNNSPREEVDDLQNRLLAILNEVHLNVSNHESLNRHVCMLYFNSSIMLVQDICNHSL